MKLEKEYNVGIKDIGMDSSITNYAILSMMEDIACIHSDNVGYGVNNIPYTKKAWIIMDWKLEVFNRPKYGDKLIVKTWARSTKNKMFFTYRDFEIYKGDTKVAIATSKWVMFDLETNKICKISDDIINLYHPDDDQVFNEAELNRLTIEKNIEEEFILKYTVKRADIDINKHMHNLNYLQVAYEALSEQVYMQSELNNVRIMYKHQILLGQKIKCSYYKKDVNHVIVIKSDDDSILHAIIELS